MNGRDWNRRELLDSLGAGFATLAAGLGIAEAGPRAIHRRRVRRRIRRRVAIRLPDDDRKTPGVESENE